MFIPDFPLHSRLHNFYTYDIFIIDTRYFLYRMCLKDTVQKNVNYDMIFHILHYIYIDMDDEINS